MVFKNSKRLSSEDDPHQISYKHPRQLDYTSFVGFVPCNNSPEKPHTSGGRNFNKFQEDERLVSHTITEFSVASEKEFDNCAFGSISGLSWVTSSTNEEEAGSELTLQFSYSPRFYDHDRPSRTSIESEEMFSFLMDYPPRKLVSIGPDHQADVPAWGSEVAKKASGFLDVSTQDAHDSHAKASFPPALLPLSVPSSHLMLDDNWEQLMGTYVIPMSEVDSSGYNSGEFGHGRADCSCPDRSSLRCVRQHVKEAREKLWVTLGQERFVELGFGDMGEDVAQKWSEEDEQVFHEVVFSNPASLGKNFWDHLSVVFPTRTKKDLVSYYFNVFMLRIRAGQNRLDPLNIDSDNDEWQASDDGDEFAITEEDEDSLVESPANQGNTVHNEDTHEDDYHDEDEDVDSDDDDGDDYDSGGGAGDVAVIEDGVRRNNDVSKLHIFSSRPSSRKLLDSHNFFPTDHHATNDLQNSSEEQDVQDESCTSYECLHSGVVSFCPSDVAVTQEQRFNTDHKILNGEYGNGSLVGMVDHGHVSEVCDAKVWDTGFFTGTKNNVDFLPTCNVIEEVFRNEMWNDNEVVDGPRSS